jgi:hypothetical protein
MLSFSIKEAKALEKAHHMIKEGDKRGVKSLFLGNCLALFDDSQLLSLNFPRIKI